MERLNLLAGERVVAKIGNEEEGERMRKKARELGQEMAKMRRRIGQMREEAKEEMEAVKREMEMNLRGMKREMALVGLIIEHWSKNKLDFWQIGRRAEEKAKMEMERKTKTVNKRGRKLINWRELLFRGKEEQKWWRKGCEE